MSGEPAGLYLHIPFCARVCPYCDFAVRTGDAERRHRFVEHLLTEIDLYADYPATFDTIYFGGGTPSRLEVDDLARIIARLRERFAFADDTRVFLEANPEDIDGSSAAALREIGVHTLSLGVQALNDAGLAFLGRQHTAEDARRAVSAARNAGFDTVSIDLIYGLPDQSETDWRHELDRALELNADHLSCYQLTIHPRTRFALLERRGRLDQLPDDDQATLFRVTHRHLAEAGLEGYEVSQFTTAERHRSRHNMKYWHHVPYLGLGPSAHSFDGRERWWNLKRADPWSERVLAGERPVEERERLSSTDLVLETLMTGLRTYAGVDLAAIEARHGIALETTNADLLRRLQSRGLITLEDRRVVPTLDGLAVADSLAAAFR